MRLPKTIENDNWNSQCKNQHETNNKYTRSSGSLEKNIKKVCNKNSLHALI